MNPKLIITSLAGVGVLGGGVAGCYYAFWKETTLKQENKSNNERTQTTKLDTSKNQETGPQTQNRESAPSSAPEDRSKLPPSQEQPLQNQEVTRASETSSGTPLPGTG